MATTMIATNKVKAIMYSIRSAPFLKRDEATVLILPMSAWYPLYHIQQNKASVYRIGKRFFHA